MYAYSGKTISLVGLLLLAASSVAATLMVSKRVTKEPCNGKVVLSSAEDDNGLGVDRTCTINVDSADCWTETDQDTLTSTQSIRKITLTHQTKLSHDVAGCITIYS